MSVSSNRKLSKLSTKRVLTFYILVFGFFLILFEGVLFGAAKIFPVFRYQLSPPWERNWIEDPKLGKRMSPFHPDHDNRGYRNRENVKNTKFLIIGDSLTYGYATPPEGAWPRHFSKLTGEATYNAGVGGYGPCEYKNVLDELLVLNPKTVILALYLGNDISNAYKSVYIENRCQSFKTNDASILKKIKEEDAIMTLPELARKAMGKNAMGGDERIGHNPLTAWLTDNSYLYKLGRSLNFKFFPQGISTGGLTDFNRSFFESANRPKRLAFGESPQFRTVFKNPKHDLLAVNLEDPRIQEGLRITQSVLLSISNSLRTRRINFLVAVFHNKQFVYAGLIEKKNPNFSPSFFELVKQEKQITQLFIKFFDQHNMNYVDTYESIQSMFSENIPPYHESDEQHPNAHGYYALAQSIFNALNTSNPI